MSATYTDFPGLTLRQPPSPPSAPDPVPNFPAAEKSIPMWLAYRLVSKPEGNFDKIPVSAKTGKTCNSKTEDVSFEDLKRFLAANDGLQPGIHIPAGYFVVDLDHCIDSERNVAQWAWDIVTKLTGYWEVSPSGSGLHGIFRGTVPGDKCRAGIEIYDGSKTLRFMSVTGNRIPSPWSTETIGECDITELYEKMLRGDFQNPEQPPSIDSANGELEASDSVQIVSTGTTHTTKYALFMDGTASGDKPTRIEDNVGNSLTYGDRSAADCAFTTVAALKHGRSFDGRALEDAIWSDYLDSCIYREEWGKREADFRRLTIARGIASAERVQNSRTPTSTNVLEDAESGLPLIYKPEDAPEPEAENPVAADDRADDEWFFKGRLLNFPNAALFGVTGDIIRKLHPQTESHPAGNLLDLLISLGSIIGRGPHHIKENTEHHTNEFGVRVGKSSKSRKGTGANRIREILKMVDSNWDLRCNAGGLGSGEMLVHRIRDDRAYWDKKGEQKVERGVEDKRLHIAEGEFASILVLQNKKDSSLSVKMRDAWDSKPLRNETKGEGIEVCQRPHVSVMADSTAADISALVTDTDKKNGWTNRFLFCAVERTKLLPHGGEDIDWTEEANTLLKMIPLARQAGRVFMTHNARRLWTRQYPKLTADVEGVLGAVTSRAEAHCVRIALILALLDENAYETYEEKLEDLDHPNRKSTTTRYRCHIDVPHLNAAFAFWSYCYDSVRIVFGGETNHQAKILAFLSDGPKTLPQIVQQLFHKNRRSAEVKADLEKLEKAKKITVVNDAYALIGQGK